MNKRDQDVELILPAIGGEVRFVDQKTKGDAPGKQAIETGKITLHEFSVAVATLRAE